MKLNRLEEVALVFVSELAYQPDTYIPLSDIGTKHGISRLFLKKIARMLKMRGLVTSREGQNGGYVLNKSPQDMSALDVMRAVSPNPTRDSNSALRYMCPLQPGGCLPQSIRHLISEAFNRYLSDVTIDQFVKNKNFNL